MQYFRSRNCKSNSIVVWTNEPFRPSNGWHLFRHSEKKIRHCRSTCCPLLVFDWRRNDAYHIQQNDICSFCHRSDGVFQHTCSDVRGATYAKVPYVIPHRTGLVAGFVGAGGNAGALVWNTIWRQFVEDDPSGYFWLLGIIVLAGSLLFFL